MNQYLQSIKELLDQESLTPEKKESLLKALAEAERQWNNTDFRLTRAIKVKYTTSVLLEETIIELEDKRKSVEAHLKEMEIEAALERVRTRTMAMHKSSEITGIAVAVNEELWKLGFQSGPKGGGSIMILDEKTGDTFLWVGFSEDKSLKSSRMPYFKHPLNDAMLNAWKKGERFLEFTLNGDLKKSLDEHYFATGFKDMPESDKNWMRQMDTVSFSLAFMKYGAINWAPHLLTEEQLLILERFAKVFEQSYTRFLDLQKAEAQAREAQIEVALEKVRSRSLAMHKSDELKEAGELLWNELGKLGIESLSSGYVLMDEEEKNGWVYAPNPATGKIADPIGLSHTDTKEMRKVLSYWKKQEPFSVVEMNEEETIAHQTFVAENGLNKDGTNYYWIEAEQLIALSPKRLFLHNFNFKQGYLMIVGGNRLNDDQIDLMLRFTRVFQQTYTRFLDLKRAEAQAREAQIEVGLERVRSRAMAMRSSEEVKVLIGTVFTELTKLDLLLTRCIIWVFEPKTGAATWWMANSEDPENPRNFFIPYLKSPAYERFYGEWKKRNPKFVYDLQGQDKADYDRILFHETGLKDLPEKVKQGMQAPERVLLSASFNHFGGIHAASLQPLSEEHFDILLRFARVLDLTYTRFLDLQKAEKQAREAIRQASVDRVRAEIASMRTTADLERITPLIWNELKALGIPFIRCGVFIMDEQAQKVHTFLSTPNGKAIANMHVPFDFDLSIITQGVSHWRRKKLYQETWDARAFTQTWHALSTLAGTSRAAGLEEVPENLCLHMLPFLQGMLYVGTQKPLNENDLQLVQGLADAFSTAYARYEDFNKLEAAKKQVESTLNELQAAQKQLIQAEKMASLGELTAGIAHEIQNPLNFVNNFSEVNKELLTELAGEMDKGNVQEAKQILSDISNNEDKISHHGKRADSIVKGMLQHSRITSSQKEAVDINALADEYLRLAYHGLRAKDKSFNATLKTDFQAGNPKISLIPQDIGRVLLNLYNNAFYAVNEKSRTVGSGYEPCVTVSTRARRSHSGGQSMEISVKDNGIGIPQKITDKIFQPFFTTKPTGQGTGLGLSLAYDIVKAHGGEIILESREGEGAEFKIQLPAG